MEPTGAKVIEEVVNNTAGVTVTVSVKASVNTSVTVSVKANVNTSMGEMKIKC